MKNTDLDLYRFGTDLDIKEVQRLKQGTSAADVPLSTWLKPSKANIKLPAGLAENKRAEAQQDMENLVEKLRPLVESFELRKRLGEEGRAYVERVHDLDKVADRFIDLYRSIL